MQFYVSIAVLLLTTIISALWIDTKPVIRPKYKGVQTAIGGAIWSQLILNVGTIVTHLTKPNPYKTLFVYFSASSIILLTGTAVVLIAYELRAMYPKVVHTRKQSRVRIDPTASDEPATSSRRRRRKHKTYFVMATLMLLASAVLGIHLYAIVTER